MAVWVDSQQRKHRASAPWNAGRLCLEVASAVVDVPPLAVDQQPGQRADRAWMRLGELAQASGQGQLRGCGNCLWYSVSGAAAQQADGWSGYCARLAVRNPRALVPADHYCDQWQAVQGGAGDWERVQQLRSAALRNRPDRKSSRAGAILGAAYGARCGVPVDDPQRAAEALRLGTALSSVILARRAHADSPTAWVQQPQSLTARRGGNSSTIDWSTPWTLGLGIACAVLYWRHPQQLDQAARHLAASLASDDRRQAQLGLISQLVAAALWKQPPAAGHAQLQQWLDRELAILSDAWRPWLDRASQLRQDLPHPVQRGGPADDPAEAMAQGWYAWSSQGWSCEVLFPALEGLPPVSRLVAGALAGALHESSAVRAVAAASGVELSAELELAEQLAEESQ